ncbi:Crp/Fnr family transcriptional regulator [uncultured Ruthenibacterium sp.]|uniref:Crp/Fnr family transcriptional regulator n=1 Tax=uncultured Ruthenibacterium sp. TaxID=1905347 RepID=UPI00349EFEE9
MEIPKEVIEHCALFVQMPTERVYELLDELCAGTRTYACGEALVLAGYENSSIGIVLEGRIEAYKSEPDGSQLMMANMGPGGVFGDVICGSHSKKSPVTVVAATDVRALWIPYAKVLGNSNSPMHTVFLQNLIALLAEKYFSLDRRLELLMARTLREKLLRYLMNDAPMNSDGSRQTPFTRAQLAAYLGCDRAALCRELSRMQRDGILEVHGRSFRLLHTIKTLPD